MTALCVRGRARFRPLHWLAAALFSLMPRGAGRRRRNDRRAARSGQVIKLPDGRPPW